MEQVQDQAVAEMEPQEQVAESATTLTPSDLAAADAGYWANFYEIELQAGRFSFKDHAYQKEILSSNAQRWCNRKATQSGGTETQVLKSIHGMIYGRYPRGVLYVFPTKEVVTDFGKSRFSPLIAKNRKLIGRFVRDTDSAGLKKIGNSFLYLRSGRLSHKVQEEDETTQLQGVPVDRFVLDEVDMMDDDVPEKARGRLGHSHVREEAYLSNPTLPDFGIDKLFKQSDQRYWFRHCSCGEWTCAELSFPQCVKEYPAEQWRERGHRGYIACNKCGQPVGISPGEWIPQAKENSDFMSGFHWSQLTSVFNDPWEILHDFNEPREGNLADVYRLRLGLPYVAAEDQLQQSQVLALCGNDYGPTGHLGPCAMGVDVGKVKHIVIGIRIGHDQYEILRAVAVSEWSDIHDLARRYNVKSGVIDIRPYEDSARQFQKQEPYTIHLCEYSESMPSGPRFNANTGIVTVNRTEAFDASHRLVSTPGMLRLPRFGPEMKEFARQVCGCAKVSERKGNKRTGVIVYRYRTVGPAGDHFRNALNYFMLAASGGKIARADQAGQNRPRRAINNFRVGVRR